jgi:hypothetical protein
MELQIQAAEAEAADTSQEILVVQLAALDLLLYATPIPTLLRPQLPAPPQLR